MESLGKRLDLTNIQRAFAAQDFRHNALRSNFRQIGLCEAVLLHQKANHGYSRHLLCRVVHIIVIAD